MSGAFLDWQGARLEGTTWQGIRYLTLELPASDPAYAAMVTVHLNQPADGLSEDNVEVTGGRRLTDLAYDVILPTDPGRPEIRLAFRNLGDFSLYRVVLSEGGTPGLRLHPFFAIAEFRFRIDCETGDCRPPPSDAGVARAQPPAIDLLTKDYNGFVALLTDWVKVHNEHWADLSSASLERVLLELIAWQGDMLSYYQDRVAAEAFIDLASQRFSMRQHALLLGSGLDDGEAARTVLAVDVSQSGFVPEGLEVRMPASADEAPVVFAVDRRTRVRAENSTAALAIAAWPEAFDAELPQGATEAILLGQAMQLAPGDRLAFRQGAFAQIVTVREVRPLLQAGWVADPSVPFDPESDPPNPTTMVAWSEPLAAPLRPWQADPPLRLHANLVDATHGRIRRAAVPSGGGDGEVVPIVLDRQSAVIARVRRGDAELTHLAALLLPEAPVLHVRDDQERLVPAVELRIRGELWTRVEHLHASRSFDLHYTAAADEDGSLWLRFGDGIKGRAVPVHEIAGAVQPESTIEVDYRLGEPVAGNVGVGTLTEIVRPRIGSDASALDALGEVHVTNVAPAVGGRQPRSLASAREMVPVSIKHGPLERAVALDDYAQAATQVPGVARARARSLGGVFNTVLVLVDPAGAGELAEPVRAAVDGHLDALRMAGREHIVRAAEYVPLEVELLLCAQPGYAASDLRDRVLAELRPGTSVRPGYFHPDRLSFGDALHRSDLIALVQGIPGVRTVKAVIFRPLQEREGAPSRAVIHLGRMQVARLDADPDFPENGVLEVKVVGLDGDAAALLVDRPTASSPGGAGP